MISRFCLSLLFCLLFFTSSAQRWMGRAEILDSLPWSVSLQLGPSYHDLSTFKPYKSRSGSISSYLRITRELESVLHLQFIMGSTQAQFKQKGNTNLNGMAIQMAGAGLVLNVTKSRLQPYFSVAYGPAFYGKVSFQREADGSFMRLEPETGSFVMIGMGFNLMNKKGFGLKLEGNYQEFHYPGGLNLSPEFDQFSGWNMGIGLIRLF